MTLFPFAYIKIQSLRFLSYFYVKKILFLYSRKMLYSFFFYSPFYVPLGVNNKLDFEKTEKPFKETQSLIHARTHIPACTQTNNYSYMFLNKCRSFLVLNRHNMCVCNFCFFQEVICYYLLNLFSTVLHPSIKYCVETTKQYGK